MNDDDKTVVLGAAAPPPPVAAPATPAANHANNALALGTRLGEFELVGLIGEGGFGIVYLAQDHSLGRKVALKEYMPSSLASRGQDASVMVRSERHRDTFETGRRSFVNEARLLAQYDHPALVKVYRFWEANGTAYMAMPFYEGRTLRDELRARGIAPEEAWITKILLPVMDALELIHHDHCFHRDIAPDNIMLLRDDRPVLLDFGAARRVISDMTQALTVILKPGYAPIEQYAEMPGMKQGAWTDVYALAAVVYFIITGKTPPPAVSRMIEDAYKPLAIEAAGRYSEAFLSGVDKALTVRPETRPQSIAEFRALLGLTGTYNSYTPTGSTRVEPAHNAPPSITQVLPPISPKTQPQKTPTVTPETATRKPAPVTLILIGLIALVGIGAASFLAWNMYGFLKDKNGTDTPSQSGTQSDASTPVGTTTSAPPLAASTTPPAARVATLPHANTLSEAVQAIASAADPDIRVALEAPPTVEIGSGTLSLTLRSNQGGLLYLFLWDKASDKFYRLFPNDNDRSETLAANEVFTIPRSNLAVPWSFAAQAPAGDWQILALVSEHPRDFSKSSLHKEDTLLAASRSEIEARLAAGENVAALIGSATCASGQSCTDRFGIGTATVAKTEPTAPVHVDEPVKPRRDPVARQPEQQTTPPRKPRPPANSDGDTRNAGNSDKAEREYMKQLNKELDQLLKQ